jgi:hypothetical protein
MQSNFTPYHCAVTPYISSDIVPWPMNTHFLCAVVVVVVAAVAIAVAAALVFSTSTDGGAHLNTIGGAFLNLCGGDYSS